MSKWTKWIEYLGGDIPVWDDEKVKIDVGDGVWIGDSKHGKWRSATRYKRLKSNVKSVGTAQKLNATPVDGVFRAVPQPIIETIGFYITACGQKARITSVYSDNDGTATGVVFYAGDNPSVELFECWWGLSGVSLGLSKEPRNFDIVGPWPGPEVETTGVISNYTLDQIIQMLSEDLSSMKEGESRSQKTLNHHLKIQNNKYQLMIDQMRKTT